MLACVGLKSRLASGDFGDLRNLDDLRKIASCVSLDMPENLIAFMSVIHLWRLVARLFDTF
jgi:hypothetical protein